LSWIAIVIKFSI